MFDLTKLAALDLPTEVPRPRAYFCGPETFRALLIRFQFIPGTQTTFQVDAGDAQTTITATTLVPDDGRFYPCPASGLPELPRSS